MTDKPMIGCPVFAARFGLDCACCGSCHVDADEYGYSLLEIDLGDVKAWVCCYMAVAYDQLKAKGETA